MTRMRSILLGAGTSLVLVLTACSSGPPLVASNSSEGPSSSPGIASTSSGGGSSGSSPSAVASTSSGGGSSPSSSPAVASKSPGGGSSGSSSPAAATKSPAGGSSGGGPGLVAVGSGTAATGVKETDDLTFVPASVTVKVGDIVGFTNGGMIPHNVTFTAAGVASQTMNSGDSFLVKVTRAGTYKYVCTFHPGMAGTITVG